MLEESHIDEAIIFSHTDPLAEIPGRLGCLTLSSHPGYGGHSGIVPARHAPFTHQFDQSPFAENRVAEIEGGGRIFLWGGVPPPHL